MCVPKIVGVVRWVGRRFRFRRIVTSWLNGWWSVAVSERCRMDDIHVRYMGVSLHMFVIKNIIEASDSRLGCIVFGCIRRYWCIWGQVWGSILGQGIGSDGRGLDIIYDIGREHFMVIVDDVDEVVGIDAVKGDKTCILQRTNVIVVLLIRVPSPEMCFLFQGGLGIHPQIRERLP